MFTGKFGGRPRGNRAKFRGCFSWGGEIASRVCFENLWSRMHTKPAFERRPPPFPGCRIDLLTRTSRKIIVRPRQIQASPVLNDNSRDMSWVHEFNFFYRPKHRYRWNVWNFASGSSKVVQSRSCLFWGIKPLDGSVCSAEKNQDQSKSFWRVNGRLRMLTCLIFCCFFSFSFFFFYSRRTLRLIPSSLYLINEKKKKKKKKKQKKKEREGERERI